jgi:hypothetical protein
LIFKQFVYLMKHIEVESMSNGSSELVRDVAVDRYVRPAVSAGRASFSIAVKDIMRDLESRGFPRSNYPQVCTSLKTQKFLRENSLEIEKIEGPPSGLSTTVVIHYRVAEPESASPGPSGSATDLKPGTEEDSAARAKRLVDGIFGLLKEELAEFGGGEAFLRWVRSDDDPEDDAFRARRTF